MQTAENAQQQPLRQFTRFVLYKHDAATMGAQVPSAWFEVLYFFGFLYGRVLPNFGIYLGGGFGTYQLVIVGTAGLLILTNAKKLPAYLNLCLLFPILIVASMWLVDLTIYPQFFRDTTAFFVSELGTWIAETIIICYLMMRPGFLKRLIVLMFLTMVSLLHLGYYQTDFHVQRLTLKTNGFLGNSNDLAAWAGFCAVCLTMWAFSARSWLTRIALLVGSIYSFEVVAQTVSRASMLLALVGLALYFVVRAVILKRGLSTLLIVAGLVLVVFVLLEALDGGTLITNFTSRLEEDSGRDVLWSISLPVVESNPLGIGSETIFDPVHRVYKGPHNVLLYFGLVAGWLPVLLTILYYAVAAIRMRKWSLYDGFLWLPALLLYAILEHNQSNGYMFEVWSIIILSLCLMPTKPPADSEATLPPPQALIDFRQPRPTVDQKLLSS